jgi:two-component system, chemotaxis family, chemotaxis protein CheY
MRTDRRLRTILVVEDDHDLRRLTAEMLREAGYFVESAADGVEALERLRSTGAISLVVLDLNMPRMNGFEFRERQVADPTLAGIPVIAVTAYGQLAEQVARLGPIPCLKKPFDYDELITIIERLT